MFGKQRGSKAMASSSDKAVKSSDMTSGSKGTKSCSAKAESQKSTSAKASSSKASSAKACGGKCKTSSKATKSCS